MNKPTIGYGPVSGFKLDGVEITEAQARRHWHDQSADWTQGAFEAMAKIILSEKPAKERKTSKKLLTKFVDHFLWKADYCQGGTTLENARQLPGLIPDLEKEAAEIKKLLDNAGKIALADSHLVEYASGVIPCKLESLKAGLPRALKILEEQAKGENDYRVQGEKRKDARDELVAPLVDTKQASTPESLPAVNVVPFPAHKSHCATPQAELPPWQAGKQPTEEEIKQALEVLKRASPQAIQKVLEENP